LLISKTDRKIRIEVGYGLEGKLTDLIAGRIIRNTITPQFKAGSFDQGVTNGVHAMVQVVKGEFKDHGRSASPRRKTGLQDILVVLFIFLVFIGRIAAANKTVGAVVGGIAAPIIGSLLGLGSAMLLGLIPLGVLLGFILGLLGPFSGGGRSTGGSWTSGGFSSGSSGGFSGGGGSFGGGGASGGW
jgi:uncharacterized protein